ncbi:bacterial low temperature requirement A protein-domain-containing protein [Apodospora peruviana]|uniref:Bacterial low temperature requirement A protein-domain-containing protein n=1 Tax=Apodospora peruviana TaxID=516989 RepID=A0AAE0I011_9PEZI|nr:bacterial low temperature requirement A protein-domain-containing protein [Apodospora peruviana]
MYDINQAPGESRGSPPLLGKKKNKSLDAEKSKRRIHRTAPWIKNPLQGVDKEHLVFAPRHEASTLELFFDLFFVANLATFTTYHSIVDHSSLFAYVGFFAIIWLTWFHVTLHDVRFAHDTVLERVAKVLQMICFVGFALVGSAFAPGTDKGDNTNFRILCYTLVLSRALFAFQYIVVGIFTAVARRTDLFLPLALNIAVYLAAAGAFAAMIPKFPDDAPVDSSNGIYSVWWVVMALESIATIAISCCWRMLSFKKTHLIERMGLLTLIVIGEGAIGVTKTISRMMGKNGLDPEGSAMVLCIVLLLIGIWMTYFDNHPHGHYGTIRQQIWSTLHFPIHLAIVGLVEGAQQVALARYTAHGIVKLESSFVKYCFKDHLDGSKLTDKLLETIKYFQLDKKIQSGIYVDEITIGLWNAGNTTGVCGPSIVGNSFEDLPDSLYQVFLYSVAAIYSSLGLAIPIDEDPIPVMFESWKLIYRYFWSSFTILVACFLVCMMLIRRNKMDIFDWSAMFSRSTAIVIGCILLAFSAKHDLIYQILEEPIILPLAVCMLYVILVLDRISAWFANRRNRKSGDPLTGVGADGHGADDEEQEAVTSVVGAGPAKTEEHRMSYNPLGGSVMPSYYGAADATAYSSGAYVMPNSLPTYVYQQPAPPVAYPANPGYASGGYLPVNNGQYPG